ncbi:MAG: asparaginase [Nostocoides sp.]
MAGAPVLAHLVRGGFIESVHRAVVAVTAADGTVHKAWGAVDEPIFPRSANKPIQALAMVRAGLRLEPRLLALASASHSGEPFHQAAAGDILAGAGLDLDHLQNTPSLPIDAVERDRWIREGLAPEAVAQNCSGKHAAMLATCVVNGWDVATYRDPGHPLQQAIAATIADLAGEPVAATAVDGCGAPVMAISLAGLARAFGRLGAAADGSPERAVADAMRSHPEYVGGTGRDVTALMARTPGLVVKDGAESVYAVGLADGRGVAVKVVDGTPRAKPVILAAVLRSLGVESLAYEQLENSPVLGHGEPVGALVAVGI